VTLSPNGRKLAVGVRVGLSLYDLAGKKEVRRLEVCFNPEDTAFHAGFSPGGRYLAAGLQEGGRAGGIVVVWDARTGRRQRVYDTQGYAFAFRGDTLTLAVAADSGLVEIYEPDEGEAVARQFFFEYRLPTVMEFRDRGRTLAMLLQGGEFVQVNAGTGRVLRRLPPPAGQIPYEGVTNADWTLFAGATDAGVVVWPVQGGRSR
jgi:WD40 repeat protein